MNRLHEKYQKKIAPELMKDLGLSNIMIVPRLKKIVVNSGIGKFRDDKTAIDSFVQELAAITGQKPSARKARLSEAGFKIKRGDLVGVCVTLRSERMWAFLDKFVNVVLPRVKDFKGLKVGSLDGAGNFSVGIEDHMVFPEVNPNITKSIRQLQVTAVVQSTDKRGALALLKALGMPIKE